MKERPILMSAPMVRAILDSRKTQTRRIVKPQPADDIQPATFPNPDVQGWRSSLRHASGPHTAHFCPYGQPGDRLWVRETCRAEELSRPHQVRPSTRRERQVLGRTTVVEVDELDGADGVRYVADDEWRRIENTAEAGDAWSALFHYRGRGKDRIGNTVPGIHMPRWASRITLEIAEVRVERLQDISADDAEAEGLWRGKARRHLFWQNVTDCRLNDGGSHKQVFAELWESVNGAASWDANPWVWVVVFRRVEQEARAA